MTRSKPRSERHAHSASWQDDRRGTAGPFSGDVAEHYARFRRGYPPEIVAAVIDRLELNHEDAVLDLGCGTGQLTLPLARHVRVAIGMDPEPDMLALARRTAAEQAVANTVWVLGSDTDVGTLGRYCKFNYWEQ